MACEGCARRRARLKLWSVNRQRKKAGLRPISYEEFVAGTALTPNQARALSGMGPIPGEDTIIAHGADPCG